MRAFYTTLPLLFFMATSHTALQKKTIKIEQEHSTLLEKLPNEILVYAISYISSESPAKTVATLTSLHKTNKQLYAIINENLEPITISLFLKYGRAQLINFAISQTGNKKKYALRWPFSKLIESNKIRIFKDLSADQFGLIELHSCKPDTYLEGLGEKIEALRSHFAKKPAIPLENNATAEFEAATNNMFHRKNCTQCKLCALAASNRANENIHPTSEKALATLMNHHITNKNSTAVTELLNKHPQLIHCKMWLDEATPLLRACQQGNTELAQFFIERDADLSAQNIIGENAASYIELYCPENKNLKNSLKDLEKPWATVRHLHKPQILEYLINIRKDKPLDSHLLLHRAAQNGDTESARILLNMNYGIINIQDSSGITPLMRAAEAKKINMVKYLISRKAKQNLTDENKEDVSFYAARSGTAEIMKLFLPEIDVLRTKRNLLLTAAAKAGNQETFLVLLKNHRHLINYLSKIPPTTPLITAIQARQNNMVEFLIKHGANPDYSSSQIEAPILQAQNLGLFNIIQILLDLGANPNACDKEGNTPLMRALQKKQCDITQLLLHNEQLKIDVTNQQGHTAFTLAALTNLITEAKLLLERGANPHIPFPISQSPITRRKITTPFTIALITNDQWTKSERLTTIQMLQKLGVIFNAQDKNGKTALMHAQEMGWQELASLLTTSQS